jgi:hypothetical protein
VCKDGAATARIMYLVRVPGRTPVEQWEEAETFLHDDGTRCARMKPWPA